MCADTVSKGREAYDIDVAARIRYGNEFSVMGETECINGIAVADASVGQYQYPCL